MSANRPAVDVAMDVSIAAPRQRVFAAMTRDPGGWWGHPYVRPDSKGLSLEGRLGGLLVEKWDDGGSVLATVTGWNDDSYLQLTGPFHLGVALGFATFELTDRGEGTTVRFSFRAIGAIDAALAETFSAGWTDLVSRRLKALVETGTRLGIAPDPPN